MANLLTATVRSSDGDAPLLSGQPVSLPVDEITLEAVSYTSDAVVKTLVTHGRKKYLVSETVAQLVSASGGELAPFTVSHKDGAQISPVEMAFPLENTSVEAISDDLKAELSCFGKRYTVTGQAGAPFTGTAAQLRAKLAAEVFASGVASVATYADLTASNASGLFKVTQDETNGGEATYYLKDGNNISWIPTQSV
jgi:hypothetical protein